MTTEAEKPRRTVRSFVRREGRMTDAQRRALEELWPRYGIDPGEGFIDFDAAFARRAPTAMEIGFGDGRALLAMATADPDTNYVGVEVHRPGVGRVLRELDERGIGNVRVICTDAAQLLAAHVAAASLDAVYIFFPDPWPKKRHHKRRLVQPAFVALLARCLKSGGRLHLATDWEEYAEHMLEVMAAAKQFENSAGEGGYSPRPEYRPRTKYEQRGARLGHPVRDLIYVRL
jgi:tRNA (guanine-N7-)-methyltransferase